MSRGRPPETMRLLKFSLIGGASTLVSYLVFASLLAANVHYLVAAPVSWLPGSLVGYVLNARHTFSCTTSFMAYSRFAVVNLASFLLGLLLLCGFSEWLHIEPLLGQLLVISLRTPLNFGIASVLVFRSSLAGE